MILAGASEILSSPGIAISGNAYLGNLIHANTATRTYTFPDTTGTVLLDNNVLGYALPSLTTGYLEWTGSAWAFGAGGSGSSGVSYVQTFGDGTSTSYTITHNIGTRNIDAQIWELTGNYRNVTASIEIQNTSINSCTLKFAIAPATNSLSIIVTAASAFTGTFTNISLSGDIVATNTTQNIGSATMPFNVAWINELHLATSTLYLGTTAVLGTSASNIQITADVNQSISVITTGTGQSVLTSVNGVQLASTGLDSIVNIVSSGSGGQIAVGATTAITLTAPNTYISGNLGVSQASAVPFLTTTRTDLSTSLTFIQTSATNVTLNSQFTATSFNGSGAGLTIPTTSFSTTGTAVIGTDNHCTATSANYAITLPAASACSGLTLLISIDSTSTYKITVTGNSSDTIDGSNTRIMWANEVAELKSNGTTWTKIGGKSIPMTSVLGLNGAQTFAGSTLTGFTNFQTNLLNQAPSGMQQASSSQFTVLRPGTYKLTLRVLFNNTNTTTSLAQCTIIGGASLASASTYCTNASNLYGGFSTRTMSLTAGIVVSLEGIYYGGTYTTSYLYNDSASPGLWNLFEIMEIPTW